MTASSTESEVPSQSASPSLHALLTSADFSLPQAAPTPTISPDDESPFVVWARNATPGSVPTIVGEYILNLAVSAGARKLIFTGLEGPGSPAKLILAEHAFDMIMDPSTQAHFYRLAGNPPPSRARNPLAVSGWHTNVPDVPPPREIADFQHSEAFLQMHLYRDDSLSASVDYFKNAFSRIIEAVLSDVTFNKAKLDELHGVGTLWDMATERLTSRDGSQVSRYHRALLVMHLAALGDRLRSCYILLHPILQYLSLQGPVTIASMTDYTSFVWEFEMVGSHALRLAAACTIDSLLPRLRSNTAGAKAIYDHIIRLASCDEVLNLLIPQQHRLIPDDFLPFQRAAALRAAVAIYYDLDPSSCLKDMRELMTFIIGRIIYHHDFEGIQGMEGFDVDIERSTASTLNMQLITSCPIDQLVDGAISCINASPFVFFPVVFQAITRIPERRREFMFNSEGHILGFHKDWYIDSVALIDETIRNKLSCLTATSAFPQPLTAYKATQAAFGTVEMQNALSLCFTESIKIFVSEDSDPGDPMFIKRVRSTAFIALLKSFIAANRRFAEAWLANILNPVLAHFIMKPQLLREDFEMDPSVSYNLHLTAGVPSLPPPDQTFYRLEPGSTVTQPVPALQLVNELFPSRLAVTDYTTVFSTEGDQAGWEWATEAPVLA